MRLQGNIVCFDRAGYGTLEIINNRIGKIELCGACRDDAEWIVPGFIDVHLHGIYKGNATAELVHLMAEQAPQSGLTTLAPALASDSHEAMINFLRRVRELMQASAPGSAKIAGSHLEGPYIEYAHKGGMNENFIRNIDLDEIREFLDAAQGTLKIMTLSPELDNAMDAVRLLHQHNIHVSAGHTGLAPARLGEFVQAGGRGICHLFDTFDGRPSVNGVMTVSLADAVLVQDELFIELIPDGVHVPPILLKMAIRAAGVDRILAITDSMCGAGLPDNIYPMTDAGRSFTLKNGDCCRLTDEPDIIVGSCLTLNRAFNNLIVRDKFSPVEACRMVSTNPARCLGIADQTGRLAEGFAADIAVLANDQLTVRKTFVEGICVYEQN